MSKKCILAFSGGLDTTTTLVYLAEKGWEVYTVTVDLGLTDKELKKIDEIANEFAKEHFVIDGKQKLLNEAKKIIVANVGFNGNGYVLGYPAIVPIERKIITEIAIEKAKELNIDTIVHGCTIAGNDQIRMDNLILANGLKPLSLVRDEKWTRNWERKFLAKHGYDDFPISKKYSTTHSILGKTYYNEDMADPRKKIDWNDLLNYTEWVKIGKKTIHLKVEFEEGLPKKFNEKFLLKLNEKVGATGNGLWEYVGDLVIGGKGRIVIEAPALLLLLFAHSYLERLILTRDELQYKWYDLDTRYAWLIYSGDYANPLLNALSKQLEDINKFVCGKVCIEVLPTMPNCFAMRIESIESDYELLSEKSGIRYGIKAKLEPEDLKGFCKMIYYQSNVANKVRYLRRPLHH